MIKETLGVVALGATLLGVPTVANAAEPASTSTVATTASAAAVPNWWDDDWDDWGWGWGWGGWYWW